MWYIRLGNIGYLVAPQSLGIAGIGPAGLNNEHVVKVLPHSIYFKNKGGGFCTRLVLRSFETTEDYFHQINSVSNPYGDRQTI